MDISYDVEITDSTFKMGFQAPRQLLLHEEFEQMVWDETLRQAHERGVMPVGPVLVEVTEPQVQPRTSELREGETMKQRMERWMADQGGEHVKAGFLGAAAPDLVQVTASVQIGLAL